MAKQDLTPALIMNSERPASNPSRRSVFAKKSIQPALLTGLLGVGFLILAASEIDYLVNTLLLFAGISVAGLWLSNKTVRRLDDPKLAVLGFFWFLKVFATLFLLYAGWMPQLEPSASSFWGYDPQRYYQYSWVLVQQDWNPVGIEQNYQGIMYYYGAMFAVFGRNPLIPALINAFVTLLGTLFLIRSAYQFMPNRTTRDWRIAYLLLIPEMLWYDVMTSRETLMAILIIVVCLAAGRHLVASGRTSLRTTGLLVVGSLAAIIAVRTTMVIPVLIATVIMAIFLRSRNAMGPFIKFMLIALGVAALMAGPLIQQMSGGYNIDYLATLNRIQGVEGIGVEDLWESKSIGRLLLPSGILQSVLFTPPRMILYLAAPLPVVDVHLVDLLSGSWYAWQQLMTLPTSVLMLLAFPYVLAGSAVAWRLRKTCSALLIIPIVFWINFIAIVGGNSFIHQRYRLMATLLFFACAWIGYTRCSPKMVRNWAVPWFGLLGVGALFYYLYKIF
jgi:hypothetical protein